MNKSFCSLAWLGITTDPDGSIRPCCVSTEHVTKDDGTLYNLGVDSLNDILNSTFYINLRKSMLEGEMIEGCKTCYYNEHYGRESRRLINNRVFSNLTLDKPTVDPQIKYFDLRLGNRCNLKCRMCSPINSSMIEDEFTENKTEILNKFYLQSSINIKDWFNTDVFDNNFNNQIKNIHTLYMTGGEPTLIKKNYDILERIISLGHHKNVTLIINTNLTNYNPLFYNLIKQFKSVLIQLSIDATDELATYIRYPSNFKQIDKTLTEIVNLKGNIKVSATPALQILNLNKLSELFDYLESFNYKLNKLVIEISPIFLNNPKHLNFIYLPKSYKVECFKKFYNWTIEKCKYQPPQFKNVVQSIKKKCYEDVECKDNLKDFILFNNELDKIRNMSLNDYNPELYNVIKNV